MATFTRPVPPYHVWELAQRIREATDDEPMVVFNPTVDPDNILITTALTEAQWDAALAGWTPMSNKDDPNSVPSFPLPKAIRVHAQHLRDFRDGVRAGTITGIGTGTNQITQAQLLHTMADIVDSLRLINARLTDE